MTFTFRHKEGFKQMRFKEMSRKLGSVFRASAKAYVDAERDRTVSPSVGMLVWLQAVHSDGEDGFRMKDELTEEGHHCPVGFRYCVDSGISLITRGNCVTQPALRF